MKNHLIRTKLIKEVHQRPFQPLTVPLGLLHIAVAYDAEIDLHPFLLDLLPKLDLDSTELPTGFFYRSNESFAVRFEPHNEFYTVTLYKFNSTSTDELMAMWTDFPGALICGVEVIFNRSEDSGSEFSLAVADPQVAGSDVMGGAARIRTDFYPRGIHDFVKIEVVDRSLLGFQAGRLLQRLCDIETYRHTALLALPQAQDAMPLITEMDRSLSDITLRMSQGNNATEILQELTELAAEVEVLSADTANRFAATSAYFAMLERRIEELREERTEGLQTIQQFMERRLDPAKRTCLSANERIERLSRRIARTSDLMRSQVDLSIEQQNQELLTGLNDRARRQLRLQAKLESFTIIVVTYYAFDLIERTLRNTVPDAGVRDDALLVLSLSVPLIAGVLWWYVRKLLKHYGADE